MRVNLFDLNLLRALDALLQERSVSRAAQRLNVTQQAMSGSLRRLRLHFDDELLIRVRHTLKPTPLGQALTEPVRELNTQIAATLRTHATFDPLTSSRAFRFVMSDYSSLSLVPHLMAILAKTAPNITCDFEPIRLDMFDDLVAGKLDFCILPIANYVRREVPSDGIKSLPLFEDDFVCVIDENHPTIGETMTREEYLSGDHTLLALGSGSRSIIEEAWFVQELHPRIIATTRSFVSLIWMLPGTSLIATTQRRLATRCLRSHPIRLVECPIEIPQLNAALQWHARNDNDPAHSFMRETLLAAAAVMEAQDQELRVQMDQRGTRSGSI